MNLKAIFNEFKSQVAFVLLLIWLLALRQAQGKLLAFAYPLFAICLMTALDVVYTQLRYKKWYWPSASFVTGLLIGLIIEPSQPIWIIALATLAAFASKQFINVGARQHIFNPAAFGIMTVSLVLGVPVTWWAVAWGKLPLLILIPAMARILFRMKRLLLPLTFLAIYFVYYLTIFDPKTALMSLLDGSLLLFALVMLPEPITSPVIGNFKYLFGVAVALVSIGLSKLGLAEVFLPSLLAADLGAFLIRNFNKRPSQSPKTEGGQNNSKT